MTIVVQQEIGRLDILHKGLPEDQSSKKSTPGISPVKSVARRSVQVTRTPPRNRTFKEVSRGERGGGEGEGEGDGGKRKNKEEGSGRSRGNKRNREREW